MICLRMLLRLRDELFKDAHYDADEDDQHSEASYEPVLGTDKQSAKTLTYKYVLELDARDNIIGGDWTPDDTTDPHPDFIWQVNDTAPTKVSDQSGATDDWSLLEEIVLEATKYMGVRQ